MQRLLWSMHVFQENNSKTQRNNILSNRISKMVKFAPHLHFWKTKCFQLQGGGSACECQDYYRVRIVKGTNSLKTTPWPCWGLRPRLPVISKHSLYEPPVLRRSLRLRLLMTNVRQLLYFICRHRRYLLAYLLSYQWFPIIIYQITTLSFACVFVFCFCQYSKSFVLQNYVKLHI